MLDWFTHHASTTPNAPALLTEQRTWSYGEVDDESSKLDDVLADHVHPGDTVAVRLDRSPALVLSALAVAKRGAVYLPLGPTLPPHRENQILATAGACHLVAPASDGTLRLAADLGPVAVEPLVLQPVSNRARLRDGISGAFYSIATSGSTGAPKVVHIAEPSLASLVAWFTDRLDLSAADRISLAQNPAFDPHLRELWLALANGAALCVPTADDRSSPGALLDWCQRQKITIAALPTPLGELVLDAAWPAGIRLRWLVVGGERLRRRPRPDCPAQVLNSYGPAEATVTSTTHLVCPDPNGPMVVDDPHGVPIGAPIGGCGLSVIDRLGAVVARGQVGELTLTGNGVALGYAQPEPGDKRFLTRQDENGQPVRWYRTGDLVCMRPDGVLEFHGRIDDQFKVDGVRLEPAEIEHALQQYPGVHRAAVFTTTTPSGRKQVGAAIVTAPDAKPTNGDLITFLRDTLLPPAVPTMLLRVTDIPTTANGKFDRAALSELAASASTPSSGVSDTAATLTAIYRDISGVHIGLHDSLYDNGANSLIIARLLAAIESHTSVRLRAVQAFRADTIAALVKLIDTALRDIQEVGHPVTHRKTRGDNCGWSCEV